MSNNLEKDLVTLLQPEVSQIIQTIKRYGPTVRYFSDESAITEILQSFTALRVRLRTTNETEPLSLMSCILPFIALFRSVETNGTIIGAGLSAIAKFLRDDLFERFDNSESVPAFRQLVLSVSKCRFESGDISSDEIALQRLVDVLNQALHSPLSRFLSDSDICLVVETIFTISVLPRIGELLRRHVELTCIEVCTIILDRIEEDDFSSFKKGTINLKISYPGTRGDEPEPLPPALAALEAELAAAEKSSQTSLNSPASPIQLVPEGTINKNLANRSSSPSLTLSFSEPVTPYSLSSVITILEHLLMLLSVSEKRNTDRIRTLSFVILCDFVERHSTKITNISLVWNLISDKFVRNIVQLLGMESSHLQSYIHQAICSVFGRYRRKMIAQTELLLITILNLLKLKPQPGKALKINKDFYLEVLAFLLLDEHFLVDLFVIYDCGKLFSYPFADLMNTLISCILIDPKNIAQDQGAFLIAEEILGTILRILENSGMASDGMEGTAYDPVKLLSEANLKALYRKSAELFNYSPNEAFSFLIENNLTSNPATPQEVAQFLRRTSGLDKKMMGEILSKPSNLQILKEFLGDFHFSGLEIDEALRLVLESFRLPGESQQIARIMEAFAEIYYQEARYRKIFNNQDAVYILAYSIVMLNTDQHNKQVRHRMTVEQFIRNNRGINDGKNFEDTFLNRIYSAIQTKEIVMPEEQAAETAFGYIWNEQMKKFDTNLELPIFEIDPYAKDMARLIWSSCLDCFKSLILSPRSDSSSKIAVKGMGQLAILGDRYMEVANLDEMSLVLKECVAFEEISTSQAGNQLIRYLARSELFRLLVKSFFDLYRLHGGKVFEGWVIFVEHLLYLIECSVVTLELFEISSPGGIIPVSPTIEKSASASSERYESSILSTLSQFLVTSPTQPVGTDLDSYKKATEFIKTCKIEEIIRDSRFLEEKTLNKLILTMTEKLEITKPLTWEIDTLVVLVDIIVHMAWSNRDRMGSFWPIIFNKFSDLAKDLSVPSMIREHAILGLGRLSLRFADQPEMQREVVQFFQLLCYVPTESFQHLAEPALSIILRIVELDPPILHGTAIWPHYFTVLALACRSKSCGPYSFGLLTMIVRDDGILFPLEFYSEYVDLLSGFIASSIVNQQPISNASEALPSPMELAGKALQKFTLLEQAIRKLTESGNISSATSWHDYIIPLHSSIAQQCYHPFRDIRQQALSLLQKNILSINFRQQGASCLYDEFRMVLIPLLEELQRPEMRKLDGNVEEIQVRAANVTAKVFLNNLNLIFELDSDPTSTTIKPDAQSLWSNILSHLLRFLTGRSDILRESIPETIKNILLVMASSGILKEPSEGGNSTIWNLTWDLLDPVIPSAKDETFSLIRKPSVNPENVTIEDQDPIPNSPTTKIATDDAQKVPMITTATTITDNDYGEKEESLKNDPGHRNNGTEDV